MSIICLAPELTDAIVDHLHDDHPSLKAMALTCSRFLPVSRFHLFQEVEMKPRYFTTHPFPQRLAHLVKRLRLTRSLEVDSSSSAYSGFFMGRASVPASPTSRQLCEGLLRFNAQDLELQGIKTSANSTIFAAVATTQSLVENVKTLCLSKCCIDVADPLTLAYSLPQLRHLRFSALTFDNSRSMIRQIERTSGVMYWAHRPTSPDWSTISDSVVTTEKELTLHEIEVHDTEWSEDVRLMMVSLFNRLSDPSETFTFRVNVNLSDLDCGADRFVRGLSPFQSFLKECGHKIRRLDLRLVSVYFFLVCAWSFVLTSVKDTASSLTSSTELSDRADLPSCLVRVVSLRHDIRRDPYFLAGSSIRLRF
jgi:hypothetical protein